MRRKFLILLLAAIFTRIGVYAQVINTVVGGLGDWGQATAAELYAPKSVAMDKNGNIYIADEGHNAVRKVNATTGVINTIASVTNPTGLAIDTALNIFVIAGGSIDKINTSGIVSGMSITAAGVATDVAGNLYFATGNQVKKLTTTGISTVVGGTGTAGFAGDGGPATAAMLSGPNKLCVDKSGNIYVSDLGNNRIRKIDASGTISTYAGISVAGYFGNGGPATAAELNQVQGLSTDTLGNLFVADYNNNQIRKINIAGIISQVAGVYLAGSFSGDGGPATSARLSGPEGVVADGSGNFFFADYNNNRIRFVSSGGTINTYAGTNFINDVGYKGDGGPVISALLSSPAGMCFDTAGNLYIADQGNYCVRKVNNAGIISTVAGNDTSGNSGDGGPATRAKLTTPVAVPTDRKGNLFICDVNRSIIRKVNSSGIITRYTGNGLTGFAGDGHRADSAKISYPAGIATDRKGNLYIADYGNNCIRMVDTNQVITTVAGTTVAGYFGDGGPATAAQLYQPVTVAVDTAGNVFISDNSNAVTRKIDTSGVISTIATGYVAGINCDNKGNILEISGNKILRIDSTGTSKTIAGGYSGFAGDGGLASQALFSISGSYTAGIVTDKSGAIFIADRNNSRVRKINTATIGITTARTTVCSGSPVSFTATTAGMSGYRVFYQWKNNGVNVGTNSPSYTADSLQNNDKITCYVTDGPGGIAVAISNTDTITVIPRYAIPSVTFTTRSLYSPLCAGDSITCTASSTYGGVTPIYDWYKNGFLDHTGKVYSFVPATSGDIVYCKLTTGISCLRTDTAVSSTATINSNTPVPLVVSLHASANTVCYGTSVQVRANSSVASSSTNFTFYLNGTAFPPSAGYSDIFFFTPHDSDVLYCVGTSNSHCLSLDTATSANLLFSTRPAVSFTSSPTTGICPGSSATCTATSTLGGSAPQYFWYKNGLQVHSGVSYNFIPVEGDSVVCKVKSSCTTPDTAFSPPIIYHLLVPDTPAVSFSVSPDSIVCKNMQVTCNATTINPGTSPRITWLLNNNNVWDGNSYRFNPSDGDIVSCLLTSSGCVARDTAIGNSIRLTVISNSSPSVSISVDPGNEICNGTAVSCFATGDNTGSSPQYDWYLNGNIVANGTEFDFTPVQGDQVSCKVTGSLSCVNNNTAFSSATPFYVYDEPSISISQSVGPVIYRGTSVTFSSVVTAAGSFSYQWMKNGKPIDAASSDTYISRDFGYLDTVYCVLTSTGACPGIFLSNQLIVDTYHGIDVYPNPNNGDFTISMNDYNANNDAVDIRIYNETGRLVYEQQTAFSTITLYAKISLQQQLPPGIYMLRLNYKNNTIPYVFTVKH